LETLNQPCGYNSRLLLWKRSWKKKRKKNFYSSRAIFPKRIRVEFSLQWKTKICADRGWNTGSQLTQRRSRLQHTDTKARSKMSKLKKSIECSECKKLGGTFLTIFMSQALRTKTYDILRVHKSHNDKRTSFRKCLLITL